MKIFYLEYASNHCFHTAFAFASAMRVSKIRHNKRTRTQKIKKPSPWSVVCVEIKMKESSVSLSFAFLVSTILYSHAWVLLPSTTPARGRTISRRHAQPEDFASGRIGNPLPYRSAPPAPAEAPSPPPSPEDMMPRFTYKADLRPRTTFRILPLDDEDTDSAQAKKDEEKFTRTQSEVQDNETTAKEEDAQPKNSAEDDRVAIEKEEQLKKENEERLKKEEEERLKKKERSRKEEEEKEQVRKAEEEKQKAEERQKEEARKNEERRIREEERRQDEERKKEERRQKEEERQQAEELKKEEKQRKTEEQRIEDERRKDEERKQQEERQKEEERMKEETRLEEERSKEEARIKQEEILQAEERRKEDERIKREEQPESASDQASTDDGQPDMESSSSGPVQNTEESRLAVPSPKKEEPVALSPPATPQSSASAIVPKPTPKDLTAAFIGKLSTFAPIASIPLIALVASRSVLSSREIKQRELDLELQRVEQLRQREMATSNAQVLVRRKNLLYDIGPFLTNNLCRLW